MVSAQTIVNKKGENGTRGRTPTRTIFAVFQAKAEQLRFMKVNFYGSLIFSDSNSTLTGSVLNDETESPILPLS